MIPRRADPTPGSTTTTWIVPARKVLVYSQQIESGRPDILGWNLVGDIHNAGVGVSRKDRAFHRADEIILRAKSVRRVIRDGFKFQVSGFKPQPEAYALPVDQLSDGTNLKLQT